MLSRFDQLAETAGDEKAGTNYHREIDGLRAVSVVAILLFHLEVAKFSGGFIGVDVFFVISGFLITRIIVSSLETGRFSFKDFYIRRSARILPALVATVGLVLPVAMYLQQPAALVHTAQEGVFALLSLSNFFTGPNPVTGRLPPNITCCYIPGRWGSRNNSISYTRYCWHSFTASRVSGA
ncbi:MAG: acyltransferase [Haliea sp.]|nr:acyltransferase [Haliea sp.]